MKIRLLSVLLIAVTIFSFPGKILAQQDTANIIKPYRVGVFAPLYLDSVFSAEGKFKFKQGMPKFIMPGIDFVNGVQLALDSIRLQHNQDVTAYIFDTKSYKQNVDGLIKSRKLDSLDLIIGSVRDIEYKQLADFALQKNIPFISTTYPNDGGITANPFLVLVNSTLKAHCEALYSFIVQNHGTDKVVFVRKKGAQEDKIASYFKTLNEPDGKPLIDIQTINVDSSISAAALQAKLDSTRQTIIIGASLDEGFAAGLTTACYRLREKFTITLLGMPNWDGFKSLLKKDEFEDFPIYFTTPYFNNKWDDYSKMLSAGYTKKYKGKPGDMVFKGFESAYLFTNLLMAYPTDFMNHLNDRQFKVFSEYNFRPVMLKKDNAIPDYFENKHLYFIRILNGSTSKAW